MNRNILFYVGILFRTITVGTVPSLTYFTNLLFALIGSRHKKKKIIIINCDPITQYKIDKLFMLGGWQENKFVFDSLGT